MANDTELQQGLHRRDEGICRRWNPQALKHLELPGNDAARTQELRELAARLHREPLH